MPRSTNDIDVFWLEEDAFQRTLNPLRESVQAITARYALNPDWFNYVAQMLIYDEILIPDGKLWKRFGPLHIYVPTACVKSGQFCLTMPLLLPRSLYQTFLI